MKIGIDKIGMYVPLNYVELKDLAIERNVDPDKWMIGLGQEKMAIVPIDQDVVSMGANACNSILSEEDKKCIDQIIFATESGLDYSKSCATYIHELLEIQPFARSYEIKQACYSATASIQIACDYVKLHPDRKVLVISSDISKYGLNTPGEATQGAGAIAILISSNPKIMEIGDYSVAYTCSGYDFWRPNQLDYPEVNGKQSTELYMGVFVEVIKEFINRYPHKLKNIKSILFHLPFARMGKKALDKLERLIRDDELTESQELKKAILRWNDMYNNSTIYAKQVGNIYTGSLYMALISLLLNNERINEGDEFGFFSYGSGSVAELFIGKTVKGFREYTNLERFTRHIERRKKLTVEEYEKEYFHESVNEVKNIDNTSMNHEIGFYLEKVENNKRYYNKK